MNVPASERLISELRRYKGVPASFAYSLANFLLAFTLQKHLSAAGFGTFAIVQVYLQFGMALSNALFCAPILLLVNSEGKYEQATIASFSKANLVACLIGAGILVGIVRFSIDSPETLALIALLAVATWMRWFYRAVELAEHNSTAPFLADIYYCVVVMIGTAIITFNQWITLNAAILVLAIGSLAAMGSLSGHIVSDARAMLRAPFGAFASSFRQHGRWALVGVVTNETTANSYAYLVTAFLGPAAFAPIAAMNLFYRPITILIQSLTQYERPRMTRSARSGDFQQLTREVTRFRLAAMGGAIGNFALAEMLLFLFPKVIGNADYPHAQLVLASFLLGGINLLRAARAGASAALQTLGLFQPLAWVTVITAPVTLILAGLAVWLSPHLVALTLVGVLLSEIIVCAMIIALLRRHAARSQIPAALH